MTSGKLYLDRSKMKLFFKIILIGIFFIGFGESKANTLLESLQSACAQVYSANVNARVPGVLSAVRMSWQAVRAGASR